MLKIKELENRVYRDKKCVGFDYTLIDKDSNEKDAKMFNARFRRSDDAQVWNMQIVLDKTSFADSQVYNISYQLPKLDVNLELVAAIGLKFFQNVLKEEVQAKSTMDFLLSDVLKDM